MMTESRAGSPVRRAIAWILGLLGVALIGLGIAAFVHDWLAASEEAGFRVLTAGEWWFSIDRGSLNFLQAIIQRYVHPEVWDPGVTTVLFQPAWLVAAVPGLVFLLLAIWIGRRRRS